MSRPPLPALPARPLTLRLALAAALALGGVAPLHAQTAPPAAGAAQYDIPAGPLAQALNRYAQQAGVAIVMDAARLQGLTTPGLKGAYGVEEGFGLLLRGSGYAASRTQAGYVLRPAPASPQGQTPVLPAVTTLGEWRDGEQGYVARRTTAGTKTDTPLAELPQSASVITRAELDDRKAQTLLDAIAYTPGVRIEQSGFDPRYDVFTIRGFDMTYNGVYRDGLRLPGANMSVFKVEPYGVENLTVLRGPSSALYGLGSPGGVVDITSKRPVDEPFGEVELMGGNFQRKQGQFDVGGRADEDGQWLYRLTGVVRDAGSPNVLGGGVNDMKSIAPALTWKPDGDTKVTFLGEYQKSETPAALPNYAWTGADGSAFTRSLGDYNSQKQEQFRVGYLAEHRIDPTFTVRQNLRYGRAYTYVRYNDPGEPDFDAGILPRSTGYVHDVIGSFVVDNQVQADFEAGGVSHKLLAGLDYSRLALDGGIGFGAASDADLATLRPLGPTSDPETNYSRYRQVQHQTGLYLQEQAKAGGWIVTMTGRYDWSTTRADDLFADTAEKKQDRKFTGRVGITRVFDNGIAPYVSYATSFSPNLGAGLDGGAFTPTTSRQIEAGVKYAPADLDGYLAASVFRIDQNHGLVADGRDPMFQIQTGEVRAKGFELEAVLELARGLKVRGAYTYLDTENVAGEPATLGRALSGTPRHGLSAWADYTFQQGTALAGLGVGVGVRYTGTSWGDASNSFGNAPHTLVDAMLSYDLGALGPQYKGLSAQINAQNLFNRDYITCDAGYCYQGMPRTVIASVKYRW